MPCDDITEVLSMRFDAQDRLLAYELLKRTCGRGVGEQSLVLAWAAGQTSDQLLDADIDAFLAAHPVGEEAEEFLHLKHFFAIKSGVSVLSGRESGGAADACAVESLAYDADGSLEFRAILRVEVLTERIQACGRCAGCGSKRTATAKPSGALA